jgi:hypothetical protein
MKARTSLLGLFRESYQWRSFFRSCCETSAFRLRAQAWQFRDELRDRGNQFQTDEVEDALLGLASELLLGTPAAQWDTEWAYELCRDALAPIGQHYAELSAAEKAALDSLSAQDPWHERMIGAELENDPAAFSAALKGWKRAGLKSMERVYVKGGAA